MYAISSGKKFKKDMKRLKRSGSFDARRFIEFINILDSGKALDDSFRNHELSGNFFGFSECHLSSDLLVVYRVDKFLKEVSLYRIGSHSEIFG